MLCVIRPEDDLAAAGFGKWWDLIGAECPAEIEIRRVESGATRALVEDNLGTSDLVLYFGHGTERSLCRRDQSVIFVDEYNVKLAARKMIVAIACSSAHTLGPHAVMDGTGVRAYLGFTDELRSVPAFHDLFGHAIARGILPLLRGASIQESEAQMKEWFRRLADRFDDPALPEGEHRDSGWAFCVAWANHDTLVVLGKPDAAVTW